MIPEELGMGWDLGNKWKGLPWWEEGGGRNSSLLKKIKTHGHQAEIKLLPLPTTSKYRLKADLET